MGVNVSLEGLKEVTSSLNKMRKYRDQDFIDKTLNSLGDIGLIIIKETYDKADFDNQPKHYSLSKNQKEKSIDIIASGDTISFLEFGTGVYNNSNRNYPIADNLGMKIGEYGKKQGRKDHWYYYGTGGKPKEIKNKQGNIIKYNESVRFTRGTSASKGMLKACEGINKSIIPILMEESK